MALFGRYLRQHRKAILAGAVSCVIFAAVFALCRLPVEAVAYPALLCALLGLLFLVTDFLQVRRRHQELERLCRLSAAMIQELPTPESIQEEDYQQIIQALRQETLALEAASETKYRDMMEYYTLWAHQIKTPIASMRLHLQNEDSPLSRSLQADLQRIEQYVEMVLAFLRLDAASNDYVFREYAVDGIIRQAVKRFSQEFIGRKIRLEYEPIDLTIVTDEKWLTFVLEQLISNALKYTREGSVRIYLREPKTLCIEDTGMGIVPEDLPRIFEKGYTGYHGRSDKKASGIGLYLCKRVCDNLGIAITARSEVGKGATVELSLEQYQIKAE